MKPPKKHIAKPVKPLFDPGAFFNDFYDTTVIKAREADLKRLGMDEMQSKRGWSGYQLPLCSWANSWHPATEVSNYRMWPAEARGWILQVVDDRGMSTCMLRRKAVREMPTRQWEELMNTVSKLKEDYSVLDDGNHSEVESEYQQEEWNDHYREEFQKEMLDKFDGVFLTLQFGERIQEKFAEMMDSNELTDRFFYDHARNSFDGDEWTEAQDGDWSLSVDSIVKKIDTSDILAAIWPPDPHQLQFKFMRQAESLVRLMLADDLMAMIDSPNAHRIVDSLLEDAESYSHSCLMLNLPEEMAQQLMAWGREQVRDEDVVVDKNGAKGRESEPHITVLYGLLDEQPSDMLLQVFERQAPFDIKLGPCSLFKNGKYDVLKMEVISPFLHALNRNVCSVAAYQNDFPDFKPHVTIAYVQPGSCDRLEGASPWDDPEKMGVTKLGQEGTFTAKEVIFSSLNGQKTVYALGASDSTAEAVNEAAPSFERLCAMFEVANGKPVSNGEELNDWIYKMIAAYEADTGRQVRGTMDKNQEFLTWIETKITVDTAWEDKAFESAVGRKPENEGELAKWIREASQAYYQETGRIAGLRQWLTETLDETPAPEDTREIDAFITTSGVTAIPGQATHRTIRRIIGRHIVDKVEIWRVDTGTYANTGRIRITYRDNGQEDSPRTKWNSTWASFDVLKWSLRNWRNLYGAPLFVDDQDAGKVAYRNPALAE